MKKLRHFETSQAALDYMTQELIDTLEDDLAKMTKQPEREYYTNEDRQDMRNKIYDIKAIQGDVVLKEG